MVKFDKTLLTAVAILIGTMMGAGFLGIPYAVSKTGFLFGIVLLVFVALFMMVMKLYMGEVALRTRGKHQLAGYAEIYLGKTGKYLMFFAMFTGIYSALVAYLIGEGQSISYVLFGNFNHAFIISLIFWAILSTLSFIGLSALKKYEKIGFFVVLLFLAAIIIFFSRGVKFDNLSYINPSNFFLPLGVILFSFLAFSAMPEVERILVGKENLMKKTIIISSVVCLFVYLIFTFIAIGNFGQKVPEIATLALGRFFSLLGVITMFTAFFASSIAIRDMFRFDFKLGRLIGWILAAFIPLILFGVIHFYDTLSFVQILSFAGVVSAGLTGVAVLLMNKMAKLHGNRKPEYSIKLPWLIIILFSLILISAVVLELI